MEQTLASINEHQRLRQMRMLFQHTAEDTFRMAVERFILGPSRRLDVRARMTLALEIGGRYTADAVDDRNQSSSEHGRALATDRTLCIGGFRCRNSTRPGDYTMVEALAHAAPCPNVVIDFLACRRRIAPDRRRTRKTD